MTTCRNIRFIASAGTGKTHQVVSLYQSLLFGRPYPLTDDSLPGQPAGSIFNGQSRIAPEHILMLTFTKNAAAEMRSRVTEAIEHELASGDPANEAFCWSLLRRLSAATISTIHSFAQQLLAAHTLHLGLAPTLTILEDADAADLRSREVEAALKAALSSSDPTYVRDLELLGEGRGLDGIQSGIISTIHSCAAWGLDLTNANPATLVAQPTPPIATDLTTLIKRLDQSAWQKSKKRDDVLAALKNASHTDIPSSAKTARQLSKGVWGKTDDIKALKQETETTLDLWASYPARIEATRLLITFLTLTRHTALRIQGRKRSLGVLDFDDLLFKARDLVRSRPSAVPELKVIIVDEAQDNSHLQNELIQLVQSMSKADMILCGDTKQTIYGWRGADPNGLPDFAKAMKLSDVPLHTSYRSQKGILDWVNDIFGGTVLGPELYDENETLTPCSAAKSLTGPSVELLLPEWETQPDPKAPISDGDSDPKPRVTLTRRNLATLADKNPNDSQWQNALDQATQAIALEARAMARRIRLLTTPLRGPHWHPAHTWDSALSAWIKAPSTPYRFRDILILLRAGTLQEVYEQALQEEGIPFTTDGKGRGFFARQETLDVANLLSWLASPNDRLAWLGLLRSPFVALSDNAIALLEMERLNENDNTLPSLGDLRGRNPSPSCSSCPSMFPSPPLGDLSVLGGKTSSIASLHNHNLHTDADTFERAAPILNHLRQLAGRISAVELIREAIRLTGYDAILAGTFHGVQRLANLQKLLSWLQSHERDETLNLQQTARRLSNEITSGREAPDAAVLDPDDDSVRINTIHAAKGLSSPVVFIPDLRRQLATDRDWILIRRNETGAASGVAGKLKQFTDDTPTDILSEQFAEALARNKDDRDRESRRLFYVACTRARDLLVLSGENPYNGNKDAWRSWVNRHLIQCDFNPSLITLHPYGDVERAWRTIAKPLPEQPIPTPKDFESVNSAPPAGNTVERYRFPVTALIGLECGGLPLRQSLASAGVTSTTADDHESPDPSTPRAQTGTTAHRILEALDYTSPIPLEDQIAAAPEWADIDPADHPRLHKQVLSAATTIASLLSPSPSKFPSPPLSDLTPSPSCPSMFPSPPPLPVAQPSMLHTPAINHQPLTINHCIRELPFAARFDHDGAQVIVDGKVDLIFFKDGRWHMVDYKFSDHSPEELKARYANQLFIYREALSAPFPIPSHSPSPHQPSTIPPPPLSAPPDSPARTPHLPHGRCSC